MPVHHHTDLLAALAGQPNSGKSTIFSLLTGMHQKIGNYPGVTVEKKSGHFHLGPKRIEIVDLPGTYSLTSYSQEERVTRDFILLERPEVIVVVLDASNFRRHLYLVFQLLEMQHPIVVCLNMIDVCRRRGFQIDVERCERMFGVPVVPTNGATGDGIDELRDTIVRVASQNDHEPTSWKLDYGHALEQTLQELTEEVAKREHLIEDFSPRWIAMKLLEGDREVRRIVQHHTHDETWKQLLEFANEKAKEFESKYGQTALKVISTVRNEKAEQLESECMVRVVPNKPRMSDRIDRIACHPIWGLFVVALIMFCTFELAFLISDGWNWVPWHNGESWTLTTPVEPIATLFEDWLPSAADRVFGLQDGALRSLIRDGILVGIGGVLTFVPLIFTVFFLLSILEQSGFVARIAMVLDRMMRCFGLHGQSVLPMILGGGIVGGCAVPAILATRTMKEPKERLLTILVIPLMNCGAKIPVYAVLIAAFFSAHQGAIMGLLVFLSWGIALCTAWVLSRTLVKGSATPLVLELPSYLFPRPNMVLTNAVRQSWHFIRRAGTIILAVNVILWALMYFPQDENREPQAENGNKVSHVENSYAGRIGRALVPVSQLAGFDWRDNVALLGGFAAKEVIVSSLATLHSIDEEDEDVQSETLATKIQSEPGWNTAKAFAMMVFVMVYAPCGATCAMIRRETASWKWTLIAMVYSTTLAMLLAVAVYQIGKFFV